MKVKNDFPDVDKVLNKLRIFVATLTEKMKKEVDEEEKEDIEFYLKQVDEFIVSIEKYLDSVCNDEYKIARYKEQNDSRDDIQKYIMELDERRTRYHSNIISSMVLIDRASKRYGLLKPFDYAEEFESGYTRLTPSTQKAKSEMTERERIKRREMGNFGLYIAASVTVGINLPDRVNRNFASAESEIIGTNKAVEVGEDYNTIISRLKKTGSKEVSKNMNDMIK